MSQRLVTLTIEKIGTKDLLRQKNALIRLMATSEIFAKAFAISARDRGRMEGLLCFLDACTDQIKDGIAIDTGEGPENWEDKP